MAHRECLMGYQGSLAIPDGLSGTSDGPRGTASNRRNVLMGYTRGHRHDNVRLSALSKATFGNVVNKTSRGTVPIVFLNCLKNGQLGPDSN